MHSPPSIHSFALFLSAAGLSACSSMGLGLKSSGGLEQVDQLLSHVERVQVESAVSKERAQAALEGLRALLAPEFRGDAAEAHTKLVTVVEQSTDQAEALQKSVKPLKRTGEKVFQQWAADLESFGNLSLRQRSQERLEETRARYDAILSAAISAQLAYDAFNGDLSDQALFLEHDFNSASVAMIAGEQEALRSRAKELARRLDVCAAACQAFVEFSAPRDQLEREEKAAEAEPKPPVPTPAPKKPAAAKPKAQAKPDSGSGTPPQPR